VICTCVTDSRLHWTVTKSYMMQCTVPKGIELAVWQSCSGYEVNPISGISFQLDMLYVVT